MGVESGGRANISGPCGTYQAFRWELNCYTVVTEFLRFQIRDLLTELSCLLLMGELYGPPGGNAVVAHLTGMHSAIKTLNSRIRILHHHLVSILKGEAPYDHIHFYSKFPA
ncbi:unnamed protein product [Sphagnum troendelagicum]|uniref:Uncharacterized protein n=1 Tax=Sphagnum troendelagicum TaxID=128251 RepID=A0ABP0TSY3_9BRYO